jgi:hypothetical protein
LDRVDTVFSKSFPVSRSIKLIESDEEKHNALKLPRHLAFVVHGIGEAMFNDSSVMVSIRDATTKMGEICSSYVVEATSSNSGHVGAAKRDGVGVIEDFQTDIPGSSDKGQSHPGINFHRKIDFIPIEWFGCIHSDEIDMTLQMKAITCSTVPVIRQFGNTALLDLLLYQTPEFRQRITEEVVSKMNKVYDTYRQRNGSDYDGSVSVVGHSLGSVIAFDILSLQQSSPSQAVANCSNVSNPTPSKQYPSDYLLEASAKSTMFRLHTEQLISRQCLRFTPHAFFALGSPIGWLSKLCFLLSIFNCMLRSKQISRLILFNPI